MKENLARPVPYGNYLLLDRVNVGGMAEVFRAKSMNLEGIERLVAIKRILPHLARDPDFSSMFIDEARIAINLRHANIAQMYELSRVGESLYIAMEYVHGRDLRALINRMRYLRKDIPVPIVAHIIAKVCEGLDYAHRKRDDLTMREMDIVHRDVSPQNVIISYEGEVKIIDFGIAKAASKRSHTEAGILKGKFGYMAPEQVAGGEIDRRADVFCTGILMYELLTTDRLFAGSSELSTLRRIRNVEVAPPSMLNRAISDELEEIVLKALAANPDDRYEYASDLADDLQRFLYTSGTEVVSSRKLRSFMHDVFAKDINSDQKTLEALLRAQPKELAPPPKEEVWDDHARSGEEWAQQHLTNQSAKSYPDTPSALTEHPLTRSAPGQAQIEAVSPHLSLAEYHSTDDDERTLPASAFAVVQEQAKAIAQAEAVSGAALGAPQVALNPTRELHIHTPEEAAQALAQQGLPPMHGQAAAAPLGQIPAVQPPSPGPRRKKRSRVGVWLLVWSLLGGLFVGMVYLLFFVPVPGDGDTPTPNRPRTPARPLVPRQPVPDQASRAVPPIPDSRPKPTPPTPRRDRTTPPSPRTSGGKRWVSVRSRPARALLYIDKRLFGRTPTRVLLKVRSQPYRVVLRKSGYRTSVRRFRLRPGKSTYAVSARLYKVRARVVRRPTRPAPPPRRSASKKFGFLSIKGMPTARIYINGIDTGRYLLFKRKLPVGTYKVHFVTGDGDVWETRVTIKAGQLTNRISRFKKK